MLQVAPRPAGCLFVRSRPLASDSEVYELAVAVHLALSGYEFVTEPQLWKGSLSLGQIR